MALAWTQNASNWSRAPRGSAITASCPPGAPTGSVWGTDVYSSDSSICTAAVHAGRLTPAGGIITFYLRGGGINYAGTTRNGVTTRNWPAWPSGFSFDPNATQPSVAVTAPTPIQAAPTAFPMPSVGVDPTTVMVPGSALFIQWGSLWYAGRVIAPQPDGTVRVHYDGWSTGSDDNVARTRLRIPGAGVPQMAGAEPSTPGHSLDLSGPVMHPALAAGGAIMPPPTMPIAAPPGGMSAITWGQNATQYRGQNGTSMGFICPPNGSAGSVYGSGPYTDDSSICTAAVHAGRIQLATGGAVTIQIMPGMDSFPGTAANGITSTSWSSFPGAFIFR